MKSAVRRLPAILLALCCAPPLFAEPAEKPVGRTLDQRFGKFDQNLVFEARQAARGGGQVFRTRDAQAQTFQYEDRVRVSKFETKEAVVKSSWLSKLKFWTKEAKTTGDHEIPELRRQTELKTAAVKDAREGTKVAAVRDLPDGDRTYLGPERAKLDRSVDPNKPLPGWTGNKLEPLTLEEVRELLNKNK